MLVRLAPRYRENMEALRRIAIGAPGPNGGVVQVPLAEVANVGLSTRRLLHLPRAAGALHPGEVQRARPRPRRRRARGAGEGRRARSSCRAATASTGRATSPTSRAPWRGLPIAVPIAIALILLLLYVSFGSLVDTLIAGSAIPMALIGGILGLWLADMSFSISAAIGFVALFGIAAMNGIMVVGCFNRLIEGGLEREAALRQTCELQMRPVLMTCVAACVGLLPAAFSTAIGSQVQRPLAIVVVGGMLLAPDPVPHRAAGGDRHLLTAPRPGYICGVTRSRRQFIDLGDRRLRVAPAGAAAKRRAGAHDAGVPARRAGLHRDVARLPAEALRRHALQPASSTTAPATAARARGRPIPACATWRSRPTRSCRACSAGSASRIACWSATATAARSRSTTPPPIPSRCAPW